MTYLTKQQIFDRVVAHARKQKQKSESRGSCLYRGPNGTKCFAGIFIPDSQYAEQIEGTTFVCLLYGTVPEIDPSDFRFVEKLQEIHDRYEVEEWESKFEYMAEDECLIYTSPEQEPTT